MKTIGEEKIRNAFSKAAGHYDQKTHLHKDIGLKLLCGIEKCGHIKNILDVGMGTGWLTGELSLWFYDALVVGLDFSEGMIEQARQYKDFRTIQADARKFPFKNNSFDLVISNLAYQWLEDLDKAFGSVRGILKKDGVFHCSIFGVKTLSELTRSLAEAKKGKIDFKALPSERKIKEALLRNNFKDVEVKSDILRMDFSDLLDLLRWLKDIGANKGARNVFFGREALRRANDYYQRSFHRNGRIYASFEVIFAKGVR